MMILRPMLCISLCICLLACSTTRSLTPQAAFGGNSAFELGDTVTLGLKNGAQQTFEVTEINKSAVVGRTDNGRVVTVPRTEISYVVVTEVSAPRIILLIAAIFAGTYVLWDYVLEGDND